MRRDRQAASLPAGDLILDRGAQAERTRLSWHRTALALAVNAAVLVEIDRRAAIFHVPAVLMLSAAVACFLFGERRYRRVNRLVRAGETVAVVAPLQALAILVALPPAIAFFGVLLRL